MIYKMTLLKLSQGSRRNGKRVSEHISKLKMRHPLKLECALNHASLSPVLGVINLRLRKFPWSRKIPERSN